MLLVSGKESNKLAMQHHSYFQNTPGTVICRRKIFTYCSIVKKGLPTCSPYCLVYVKFAKSIMHKITKETEGLTGSGVKGEMSEKFDCEFGDINEGNNKDDDDYNGIGTEDF